jgi:hypothetical protein
MTFLDNIKTVQLHVLHLHNVVIHLCHRHVIRLITSLFSNHNTQLLHIAHFLFLSFSFVDVNIVMMDIVRFHQKTHHVPFYLHDLMHKLWVHKTAHNIHCKDSRIQHRKSNLK